MDSTIVMIFSLCLPLYEPVTALSQLNTHKAYFLAETEYKLHASWGMSLPQNMPLPTLTISCLVGMIHVLLMYLTDNSVVLCVGLFHAACVIWTTP